MKVAAAVVVVDSTVAEVVEPYASVIIACAAMLLVLLQTVRMMSNRPHFDVQHRLHLTYIKHIVALMNNGWIKFWYTRPTVREHI